MNSQLDLLQQEYETAEDVRCNLLLKILNLQKKNIQSRSYRGLPGAECSWNGKVLKFIIPDKPPIIKRTDILHEELTALWAGRIVHAYDEARLKLHLDQVWVLIKIATKDTTYWDVDNRAVSLIINGLRATGIIEDDRWQYVSVSVMGAEGSVNKTEVLVVDGKHLLEIWDSFDFNVIPM